MCEIERDPCILRDIWFAKWGCGDGRATKARVVISRRRVYAWASADPPSLVLNSTYDPAISLVYSNHGPRWRDRSTLVTTSGLVTVTVQRGCDCESRLGTWEPWDNIRQYYEDY